MKAFILNNQEACAQVKHVILDKDCREISAVESLLPAAHVSICRFHVLQIFDRQIASKGRDANQKEALRKVCQRLVFAKSAEVYETAMGELQDIGGPFLLYFVQHWNLIQGHWMA